MSEERSVRFSESDSEIPQSQTVEVVMEIPPAEVAEETTPTPAASEETPGEAPAQPEEPPAEPEQTPAEPEQTPAEPEETPAEPEETPAEPEVTSAEPGDTPTRPEVTPAEPNETPAEPEDAPAEPEVTSTEPEETPARPEVTPAEPNETPAEPEDAPAEPEVTSTEPEQTPAQPEVTPAEPEKTPAQPEGTPAEPEETPAEPDETPAEPEDTPAEPEDTPAEPEVTPAELEDTPAEPEEKPAEPAETPAEPEQTPAEPEDTPAKPEEMPATPMEESDDLPDELPDDFLVIPVDETDHHYQNGKVPNGAPSHLTESDTDNLKTELSNLSKNMDDLAHKFDILIEQSSRPPSTFGPGGLNPSLKGTVFLANNGNDDIYHRMAYHKPHTFPAISGNGKTPAIIDNIPPPEEEEEDDPHGDENKERGNWSNHADFVLSCLGYAVGLGNVWRFPYLCYKNGGGAFFIPYFIMLIFVGMPIVYLEISLGQFSSQSCLTCWNFAPIFAGVGVAHYLISFLINIYYNVVIAWSFYYFFASMTTNLPWTGCNNAWNTMWCRDRMPDVFCNETSAIRQANGTCLNSTTQRLVGIWNVTAADAAKISRTSAAAEYYDHYVLGRSQSFDDMGTLQWELALCLLVAWLVVFFCMFKGIKSSGKAVWFTALFPYVVLLILLIRGLTLPGYYDGIIYYTTPDFSRLTDSAVWVDAAVQIFFSLSACMGGLITLSSYNRFKNNNLRDTLIVCVGNSATSIFAGFAVFSFLGYQAYELQTTVDKVATSGPGLAFVVYPDIIAKMPIAPLWAVLFFFMLILLGLDSAFAGVEACVSGIADRFPAYFRTGKRKTGLLLVICVITYILGLSMCAEGGVYMLTLFDNSAGGWAMMVVGIFESVALTWVYGPRRLVADLRCMTGNTILLAGPLPYWWLACWCFITPLLLTAILIFGFVDWAPLSYDDYMFPVWADVLGVLMTVFCVIFIPVYAVYAICSAKGTFLQRMWEVSSPTADWGPALPKNRRLVARYTPNFLVYPNSDKKESAKEIEAAESHHTNYENAAFEF